MRPSRAREPAGLIATVGGDTRDIVPGRVQGSAPITRQTCGRLLPVPPPRPRDRFPCKRPVLLPRGPSYCPGLVGWPQGGGWRAPPGPLWWGGLGPGPRACGAPSGGRTSPKQAVL